MTEETPSPKTWRNGGMRILLITAALLSVNAFSVLAARTRATMRDIAKENRESREWYELYRDVMAAQNQSQPRAVTEGDPVAGLGISELKSVVRWGERKQSVGTK